MSFRASTSGAPAAVRMEQISKCFGATRANVDVDFDLAPGEVHALLGENGAGKSTLMSILFGLVAADTGRILLDEEEVQLTSPADALRHGIGMVHQHFMLVPNLTVAENIAVGSAPAHHLRYPRRRIETEVAELGERNGLGVDPRRVVGDLPVEEQQRVEILRLLYRGARTLILDEPTASLGSAQVEALVGILKALQARGHSIVIVTHKLDEVMEIGDRATVLRAGRCVARFDRSQFARQSFTDVMFDRLPEAGPAVGRPASPDERPRLRIAGLTVPARSGRPGLRGLHLTVRPGEIVGLAGVAGNGQDELVGALSGVLPVRSGHVHLDGEDITGLQPLERRRRGVRTVPEDRQRMGLVMTMTVAENLALTSVAAGRASRRGVLRRRRIETSARRLIDEFDIRPDDPFRPVAQLSGGNQQKVVMARELSDDPRLLVAACPTRGLDLAASAAVHRQIARAAEQGCAVLLISSDLDEVLTVAQRVAVIFEGRVVYDVVRPEATSHALGLAMVGQAAAVAALHQVAAR